jgi:hypothetical protein
MERMVYVFAVRTLLQKRNRVRGGAFLWNALPYLSFWVRNKVRFHKPVALWADGI